MTAPITNRRFQVERAPFASESGLQEFVEDHAHELFGVRVVASSRKGGNGLFKIDILAEAEDGRPWIIECKHDLVGAAAVEQLRRYQNALVDQWNTVSARFSPSAKPEPQLVAIGYRFACGAGAPDLLRVGYRYDGIEVTPLVAEQRQCGLVLYNADTVAANGVAHPKVVKRFAIEERLRRDAPELAGAFWALNSKLEARHGVKPTFSGKNHVRYSHANGLLVEAIILPGKIEWRGEITSWRGGTPDVERLFDQLVNRCDASL